MLRTVTQLLWEDAGRPTVTKKTKAATGGVCAFCGRHSADAFTLDSVCNPLNFSNRADLLVPSSQTCCHACTWVMSGKPPNTLRLWSVLYRKDGFPKIPGTERIGNHSIKFKRNNWAPVADLLSNPPDGTWWCALAVSGKIHTVPYARINNASDRWCVRYERENVFSTPSEFSHFVSIFSELFSAGFSKRSVLTRIPRAHELARSIDVWKSLIKELPIIGNTAIEQIAMSTIKEKINE